MLPRLFALMALTFALSLAFALTCGAVALFTVFVSAFALTFRLFTVATIVLTFRLASLGFVGWLRCFRRIAVA